MVREPEYISLKEAAQISGYTADYLGQLIRGGKLQGKQVFLNVAWMTTREALEEYAKKDEKTALAAPTFLEKLFTVEGMAAIFRAASWTSVVILACVVIFLAFVFASSLDEKIEDRSLKSIEYD